MKFQPTNTDFTLSPFTGMTRESWTEAGIYLLEGVFRHIKSLDDPVIVRRTETKITYPHPDASPERRKCEEMAERFEGLARTFLIAAPLIHDNPNIVINGFPLKEYYQSQILKACTRESPLYVGNYHDLSAMSNADAPCFQQTVETCALVIGLWACREQIWTGYTAEERDKIADFLSGYAHAHTVPQNWRLFNMLDLAFLHNEGYPIDREIMLDHAASILSYYAGDGWYRDGQSFDYYSCWAFQFYAPLWNVWYGYRYMSDVAKRFERYSDELMKTYPDFFDADGFTNMWGRSNIYRFASVSAFDGNLLLPHPTVNCGRARRIASGSLLQFLSREDFLIDGVPTLGFYGEFSPLVQGYSCAESVYWLGKAFLLLHLPKNHPFWTEKENNGTFDLLEEKGVRTTTLNAPALCFSNHKANGTTLLRTGKVVKDKGDLHGICNYGKLCYSTKYPWESGNEAVSAQEYVIEEKGVFRHANVTLWRGRQKGVLYRRQYFDYDLHTECHWLQAIDLADFAVPYGLFRADRLRLVRRPVKVTLSSFGFPDNGTQIIQREKDGMKAVILKGYDATGRAKQLAMTVFAGFDRCCVTEHRNMNPDSPRSLVIYAEAERKKEYGYEPYLLCSQTLTREDHEDFTDDELFPLRKIVANDEKSFGAFLRARLFFADGTVIPLNFSRTEGNLSL